MQLVKSSRQRFAQTMITFVLGLVLFGIIGTYVYIGTERAKIIDVPGETTVEDNLPNVTPEVTNVEALEIDRRTKILEELTAESVQTSVLPERESVLEQLIQENEPMNVSEANRFEELEALQNMSNQNQDVIME